MLQTNHLVLLTDALRPPPGWTVDHAVTTTYSLHLNATLVAPMTFAAAASDDVHDAVHQPSAAMLDAVQRYVDRTTVFVQAGGIDVPRSHSRVLLFLENSIHEVEPPNAAGTFHPKIWAVRYVDDAGHYHHRFIMSSRNLTLDESWDTILVLDEAVTGTVNATPAAQFVAALPDLAIRPLPTRRQQAITDLTATMSQVQFAVPEGYTTGRLLPLGLTPQSWSFPTHASKALVLSPFISGAQLREAQPMGEAILVSRAESLDELGTTALQSWATRVVYPALDDFDPDDPSDTTTEFSGLHAKTAIYDVDDGQSVTLTGSANFTRAAWTQNVEFNAVLTGPTHSTGVEAVLGEADSSYGLSAIIEPYTPAQREPLTNAERKALYAIEMFHRELARSEPTLELTAIDTDTVSVQLRLPFQDHDLVANTRVWLSSVPSDPRSLHAPRSWEVAPVNVTTFLAVETTTDGVTRRCVLTCRLTGQTVDRRKAVLAAMLSSPERVLRYIALLLGIETHDGHRAAWETSAFDLSLSLNNEPGGGSEPAQSAVLFEPLIKATQDPAALARIATQIDELRSLPAADAVLSAEFFEMWDTVLEAVSTGGQR